MGAKRLGGKRPGGKRLGGETTRGGNGLGAKRPGFLLRHRLGLPTIPRDQARGRLGRNSRPRGRNFALNGTQGEVGVSLKKKKKKKIFFFF